MSASCIPSLENPHLACTTLAISNCNTATPTLIHPHRAVFKLARAGTRDKRESLLRFLEQAAEAGEPAALEMRESRGAEVYQLVAALRDAREGRPAAVAPPEEALSNLVRAVAALAVCPQNRRYLLEAGCLDALADALAAPQPELATLAVQVWAGWVGLA